MNLCCCCDDNLCEPGEARIFGINLNVRKGIPGQASGNPLFPFPFHASFTAGFLSTRCGSRASVVFMNPDVCRMPGKTTGQGFRCLCLILLLAGAGCGPRPLPPEAGASQSAVPVSVGAVSLLPTEDSGGGGAEDEAGEADPSVWPSMEPGVLMSMASEWMQAGRVDLAIAAYRSGLERQDDDEEAHFNLAFLLAGRGDRAGAIHHYGECLRIWPEYVEAHNNLGNLLRREGRLREAIHHLTQAVELDPDRSTARNNLGSALASEGRLEEALPHLMRAVALNPSYAEAHANLGTVYLQQGRRAEAVEALGEALRLNPGLASARRTLARIQAP
jgi:Tfp pilus assembly protein PilF